MKLRPAPRWVTVSGKVAGWAVTLFAAALLIAFIGWIMLPRVLNLQAVVVLTGSMEPALPIGSIAFVEKDRSAETVQPGDILTFYRPDVPQRVLVTHRVVEVVRERGALGFRTKGDANSENDDWVVPAPNVVGTVSRVIPYMGHVTDHVRGRNGFLLLMGIPGGLIIISELNKIRREIKVLRQEKSPS
jgi:signal peptidase I